MSYHLVKPLYFEKGHFPPFYGVFRLHYMNTSLYHKSFFRIPLTNI